MPLEPAQLLGLLPAAGAAGTLALTFYLVRQIRPRAKQARLSEFVPWSHVHPDGRTVITDSGGAFRVYELRGVVYAGKRQDEIDNIRRRRHVFFQVLKDSVVDIRIISHRRKIDLPAPITNDRVLLEIDNTWHQRFRNSFTNTHYAIFTVSEQKHVTRIDDAERQLAALLGEYEPAPLKADGQPYSPLQSFLATYLNHWPTPAPAFRQALHERLPAVHIENRDDGITVYRDAFRNAFTAAVGLRSWPEHTSDDIVIRLLSVPCELTIALHAQPYSKEAALRTLLHGQKQASLTGAINPLIGEQWSDVSDEVGADRETLYQAETTVFVSGDSEDELAQNIQRVRGALGPFAIQAVQEQALGERLWWGRLPGYDYFSRGWRMVSGNIADLTPLPDEPRGHLESSWGPRPIRFFPTPSGSPYALTFHVSEAEQSPPHFAVIGQTGSGKTVTTLFNLFGALAAHPDLACYIFDRHLGMRVAVEALNGDYLVPESDSLPLNPFDRPNTQEERAFLSQFFSILTGLDDDDTLKQLDNAIRDIMVAPVENRRLSTAYDHIFPPGPLKKAMQKWVGSDRFGRLFNGERDAFTAAGRRVIAFDMTSVMEDAQLGAALTYYFSQGIRKAVAKGRPHIIWIDEAAPLLANPLFARHVQVWLREHRKLDGAIGLAFQEIAAISGSSIAETIKQNVTTFFFWPGSAQTLEEVEFFNLTQAERAFVFGQSDEASRMSRPVLVKRPNHGESVLIETDLSALGGWIKLFQSGPVPVARMQQTIKQHGATAWIGEYVSS